jgi:sporulation protein YlmC with PRC-barrel domain
MNTNTHNTIRLALIALTGVLVIPALSASEASAVAVVNNATPPINAVRLSDSLGGDVFSTDGVRVGDVVDCVLQFSKLPQLRYVIVKSGGFFGKHADERAIPADAITLVDKQFHVSLTRAEYNRLPVLPVDHRSFLSDPDNLANMAKLCSTPLNHADLNGTYVRYSDLHENEIVAGKNGERLGGFSDLWVDFNANEAPFLEFTPTANSLTVLGADYFDLPTTQFVGISGHRINFAVGEDEIKRSKAVDDVNAYVAAAGEKLELFQTKTIQ